MAKIIDFKTRKVLSDTEDPSVVAMEQALAKRSATKKSIGNTVDTMYESGYLPNKGVLVIPHAQGRAPAVVALDPDMDIRGMHTAMLEGYKNIVKNMRQMGESPDDPA